MTRFHEHRAVGADLHYEATMSSPATMPRISLERRLILIE